MKKITLFLLCLLLTGSIWKGDLYAQGSPPASAKRIVRDTIPIKVDSVPQKKDTLNQSTIPTIQKKDTTQVIDTARQTSVAAGQDSLLHGTVQDQQGNPIAGATILSH